MAEIGINPIRIHGEPGAWEVITSAWSFAHRKADVDRHLQVAGEFMQVELNRTSHYQMPGKLLFRWQVSSGSRL